MEIKSSSFGVRVNGKLVLINWNRSDTWSVANRHVHNGDTGEYLGLIFEQDSGEKTAYDFAGRPVDGSLKTVPGMVKRLMRIRAAKTAAEAPTPCDACGYDIEPTDDEAQGTEENGETINTCGGCADELGTLVLDARDGKLNRQAPRGKRPTNDELESEQAIIADGGEATIEQVFDRLAVSLALAGPVVERLRKSVVDDDGTERPAPRKNGKPGISAMSDDERRLYNAKRRKAQRDAIKAREASERQYAAGVAAGMHPQYV